MQLIKLNHSAVPPGSGVMSGTAVDLEVFQRLGFGDPNL